MENISDIPIKRKVGRPRKWTYYDGFVGRSSHLLPPGWKSKCRRSQVNEELRLRCMNALGFFTKSPELEANQIKYEWLFPFDKGGESKQGKNCILYELGRIDDDELIRLLADKICERKYKSYQAIEYIKLVLAKLKEQCAE